MTIINSAKGTFITTLKSTSMAAISSINILFRADLKQFSSEIQNASREMKKYGSDLQSVGNKLTVGVTLPILGIGAASLKTFGDIQALQKGLISVMGSSEAAAVEFEKLKQVAKLPGLGLEEAVRGSINLQAAGFSADEARRALLSFGNALATVGKGKRELDLVTLAITQLNNKSGGFGQDLRQLTEQLPQLRSALQAAFGTVDTEEISKSGVTGKQVVNALIAEFEKLPKVTGGFNNSLENLGDNVKIAFSNIGESINKAFNVEGLLNRLSEIIQNLSERFSNLSPQAQKAILIIAGAAAAIGPLLLSLGALASALPVIASGFALLTGPIGLVIVAVGALAVVVYKNFDSIKRYIQQVSDRFVNLYNDSLLVRLAIQGIVATFKNMYEVAKLVISNIYAAFKFLSSGIFNIFNSIGDLITAVLTFDIDKIKAAFKNAFLSAKNNSSEFFNSLKNNSINFGKEFKNNVGNALDSAFNKKAKKIDVNGLVNSLKPAVDNINTLNTGFKNLGKAQDENAKNLKSFAPGTIAFYENQIDGLQKLQKEQATSNAKWKEYQATIEAIQTKIDALRNTGVKVAKPQLQDDALTTPAAFSLADLKDQKAYFEGLREQFSTTKTKYESFKDSIENVQIKINDIEGVEEVKQSTEEVKSSFLQLRDTINSAIEASVETLAIGFGEFIANIANGGNAISGLKNLFLGTLGDLLIQIGKIAITTAISIEAIKKSLQTLNPVVAAAAGIAAIALGSLIKSQLSDAGAFANGGVVGGSSPFGDKLFARVNSGEMILNKGQQRNLANMINPAVSASDVAIQLVGGFDIEGTKLKLVLDRTDARNKRTGS